MAVYVVVDTNVILHYAVFRDVDCDRPVLEAFFPG
jgi:hypothetical protein